MPSFSAPSCHRNGAGYCCLSPSPSVASLSLPVVLSPVTSPPTPQKPRPPHPSGRSPLPPHPQWPLPTGLSHLSGSASLPSTSWCRRPSPPSGPLRRLWLLLGHPRAPSASAPPRGVGDPTPPRDPSGASVFALTHRLFHLRVASTSSTAAPPHSVSYLVRLRPPLYGLTSLHPLQCPSHRFRVRRRQRGRSLPCTGHGATRQRRTRGGGGRAGRGSEAEVVEASARWQWTSVGGHPGRGGGGGGGEALTAVDGGGRGRERRGRGRGNGRGR